MQTKIFSSLFFLIALIGILLACLPGPALAATPSGNWQVSTVDGDIKYYPFSSVAFDRDNIPHVAFRRNHTRTVMHAWQSGGTWSTETIGRSDGTFTTSLAIDADGNPAVSYGNGLYFGNLMFARKTAGSWDGSIVAHGTMADAGQYSSLVFDQRGVPHITYNDGQVLASLYYASLNTTTGTWEFSLIDDDKPYTGDAGYSSSLQIDAAGHPHVAYISDDPWGLRYATSQDGVNWTVTKLDELDRMNIFWRTYTGVSLALDSRGYPHISYYNQTSTDRSPAELRYLSWNGNAWDRETVVTLTKRDLTTSLAIDAQDIPHIAYCDVAEKSLKYATRSASGEWSSETAVRGETTDRGETADPGVGDNPLLRGKDIPRMPSLALDRAGNPGIIYFDWAGTSLKFAKRVA
jgi:hypothetical protein